MTELFALIRRNVKLYFKDKGMFIPSLITPVILLVLYVTFLRSVYVDSFRSVLDAAQLTISDKLLNGCVGGQLISSILAVSSVTVAFCTNLLMIQDKAAGIVRDLTVAPIRSRTLALGYYFSALFSTMIVCVTAAAACLVYIAFVGWYMTVSDILLMLLDILLLALFGTALSSCIHFFLSTNGQASAVATLISSGYGFISGAYMPISSFSEGLQKVLSCLPGTYGTVLLRSHAMRGSFAAMQKEGVPVEVIDGMRAGIDCSISFFGTEVEPYMMYIILGVSILVLLGLYILMNFMRSQTVKRNKRS